MQEQVVQEATLRIEQRCIYWFAAPSIKTRHVVGKYALFEKCSEKLSHQV